MNATKTPNVTGPWITLKTRSIHWKDRVARWHLWRIEFLCSQCGRRRRECMYGTKEEIEEFYFPRVCEKCSCD
jgi:hypothetical protein